MKYWYESHLDGSIYSGDTKIPIKQLVVNTVLENGTVLMRTKFMEHD